MLAGAAVLASLAALMVPNAAREKQDTVIPAPLPAQWDSEARDLAVEREIAD